MFPIHLEVPIGWPGPRQYARDEDLRLDGDFLSWSYCVRDGKYFAIRCRLPIQIAGGQPAAFMYTAWASFDRPDFEGYLETMKAGKLNNTSRTRARLVNRLSGFADTSNLMGTAFQQDDGGPPLLIIQGVQAGLTEHPLVREQRVGIGVDRVLDLFAAYSHDMRAGAAA